VILYLKKIYKIIGKIAVFKQLHIVPCD